MLIVALRRFAVSRLFPTIGFQTIIESRSTEDPPGLEIAKSPVPAQLMGNPVKRKHYFWQTFLRDCRPEPGLVIAVRRRGREVTNLKISLVFTKEWSMVKSMDSSVHRESTLKARESGSGALQTKADRGDADAQFDLGVHYSTALGDALDFAQAASWYGKAAQQGHALAQFNLGVMFARGQGVPQDDAAAAGWTLKAAEGGDAGGQYDLGTRHYRASLDARREDVTESRIEAYKWLHLAATQEYRDSVIVRQRVTLTMSRAEFDEGNRRAAGFVARKQANPHLP